mmetsp:Transcript_50777/g.121363  ORF Transcript_50777/g.121363 Transcript_50777/m.121363 type:complete len:210 (-) Transcript_50777:187-816(-)
MSSVHHLLSGFAQLVLQKFRPLLGPLQLLGPLRVLEPDSEVLDVKAQGLLDILQPGVLCLRDLQKLLRAEGSVLCLLLQKFQVLQLLGMGRLGLRKSVLVEGCSLDHLCFCLRNPLVHLQPLFLRLCSLLFHLPNKLSLPALKEGLHHHHARSDLGDLNLLHLEPGLAIGLRSLQLLFALQLCVRNLSRVGLAQALKLQLQLLLLHGGP